ncbi:MAG TPA: hypothetical protein PKE12_00160 [Kiritimatiellia bacterium]|nr:hypothetical protein [Kiritimatiellia bacterium]
MNEPTSKPVQRPQRLELEFLEGVRRRVPGHEPVLQALGHLYTRVGRYQDGLQVDLELTRLQPRESQNWYNLGCSQALVGQRTEALASLTRAVELGYADVEWMRKDGDLESLRGDPAFDALCQRAAAHPRWGADS